MTDVVRYHKNNLTTEAQTSLEVSSRDIPVVHTSQLGPGRAADWVDGVVGKVYMYITGYVSVYPMEIGGRD